MADDAHSLCSASGSDAWGGPCPGKPAMEKGRKTTSKYADEGTAAHTLASWALQDRIAGGEKAAADWIGTKITVKHQDEQTGKEVVRTFTVDQEMAEHIDGYVDFCMLVANARSAERFCETRVHYHEYLGVPKALAWGTCDFGAIQWDQPELEWEGRIFPAGDELIGVDLKYGAGRLVTADTMQLRLYLAGLLWEYGHLGDFTRVRMVIYQPRKDHVDEVVLTVAELLAEVAQLRPNVPRVIEAMELADAMRAEGLHALQIGERLYERGLLNTSDKGCAFCDAAAVCPAMINDVGTTVSGKPKARPEDFDDLTVDGPEEVREYGGNYLASAYLMLDRMEVFAKAVRAEIDRRVLLKGEQFAVCKVVPGKKGPRRFRDAGEAELLAASAPAPIKALLYKTVLKTPTQIMDKALKTSPMWAAKFAALVEQSQGKPAVVPITDRRQAMSHKAAIDDFDDLSANDDNQPAPRMGAAAGSDRHPFR